MKKKFKSWLIRTLRKWLNIYFLGSAFSAEEKASIVSDVYSYGTVKENKKFPIMFLQKNGIRILKKLKKNQGWINRIIKSN